jgi:hypothetical protein
MMTFYRMAVSGSSGLAEVPSERARDPELQRRLWQESERLTGVSYQFATTGV